MQTAITFLEYYRLEKDSTLRDRYFHFVSQAFNPNLITELFNEFEESYNHYPWRFWHKDESLNICIEVPNNFCERNNYVYFSLNAKSEFECEGRIKIVDDFISMCQRAGVKLTFKIGIANQF